MCRTRKSQVHDYWPLRDCNSWSTTAPLKDAEILTEVGFGGARHAALVALLLPGGVTASW
jgi:hypothetical protein